jgi:hypothetical protein
MSKLNQITSDEIERLKPAELVDLLRILLHAEARLNCISNAGIHVPHQITVADEGNDGEWNSTTAPSDYIPRNVSIYQCKACKISKEDCAKELFEKKKPKQPRKLKSQVAEAINAQGALVFFCSYGYVKKAIKERLKHANDALDSEGIVRPKSFTLAFIDGNRIADWVNLHAAAFAFVCRCQKRSASATAADFKYWSGEKDFQKYPFQSNSKIDSIITQIRTALSEPQGVVRVTGPCGLGKTRIAFEVLNRVATGDQEKIRKSLCNSAVYLDMQMNPNGVLEWVHQLNQWGVSGVVIVDNCSRKDHNKLHSAATNSHSKISLLTLDYVPETPFGSSILHLNLEPETMRDIVPKILAAIPGLAERLTPSGISRISDFAQGFPQIAVLTAEAEKALDLASLNKAGKIADKLLWGYDSPDADALNLLRCVAAFTDVGKGGRHEKQLAFILSNLCEGLTETQFNTKVKRFRKSRVLQDVGDFLMVAPTPLAVALAADWLEDLSEADLIRLLPGIEECGLTGCFARRLQQLDFSDRALELSAKLMGPSGPFSSAEVLDSEAGSRVFRSLSELNPLASIQCLTAVYGSYSPAEAAEIKSGRRNLVWALEALCWRSEHFGPAARLLLIFASGENETWANNATAQFCQLFQLYLSGTQCPALDRLIVIEEGLASSYPEVHRVCVAALGHALKGGDYSRSSGSADPRPAELDWRPKTYQEMWDYWKRVFQILHKLALNIGDSDLRSVVIETLGGQLGAILRGPLAEELYPQFKEIADMQQNCWPTARDSIKWVLTYEKTLNPRNKEATEKWLECVNPTDLRSLLEDRICKPGWDHEEQPDGSLKDLAEEAAIALAQEQAKAGNPWLKEIEILLTGDQQQTFAFGQRAAELADDPVALFDLGVNAYRKLDSSVRNPQLLRGIIRQLSKHGLSTPLIESIAADKELRGDLLVPLTMCAFPQIADFKRVADLVMTGDLAPLSIDWFALGGVTCEYDPTSFSEVLTTLLEAIPDTAPWILHIVHMSISRSADRFSGFKNLLSRLVMAPEVIDDLRQPRVGYAWKVVVDQLLKDPSDDLIRGLAHLAVVDASKNPYFVPSDSPVAALAGRLLERFPKIAWPVFSCHLRDQDRKAVFSVVEILCRGGFLDDSGIRIWDQSEAEFRTWAAANPDIFPSIAARMPFYTVTKRPAMRQDPGRVEPPVVDELGNEEPVGNLAPDECHVWHPLASCLLELSGSKDLISNLASRLFSFGSTGSRVPYLQSRLRLARDLEVTDHAGLRSVARALVPMFEAEIERESKRDAQEAAGIRAW